MGNSCRVIVPSGNPLHVPRVLFLAFFLSPSPDIIHVDVSELNLRNCGDSKLVLAILVELEGKSLNQRCLRLLVFDVVGFCIVLSQCEGSNKSGSEN